MKKIILFFAITLFMSAFTFFQENPLFEVPKGWDQPAYDFSKNPLTQEKITLFSNWSCCQCYLPNRNVL
jgi:hypothetical protein